MKLEIHTMNDSEKLIRSSADTERHTSSANIYHSKCTYVQVQVFTAKFRLLL